MCLSRAGRTIPGMVCKSHFSDSGCGRLGLPAAEAKAGVWLPPRKQAGGLGLRGPQPSLPYTPPPRILPFIAPHLSLQPHPNGSRLPYMVTAGPPAPGRPPHPTTALRPHRTRPPPCKPSVVRLCPTMEDLGEWGPGPLVPSPASTSGPASPSWSPPALPGISSSCLLSSRFCSQPAPPSRLHVPLPASPFLPFPGRPLPPSFLSLPLHPQLRTRREVRACPRAPGLRGSGMGGVGGVLVPEQ